MTRGDAKPFCGGKQAHYRRLPPKLWPPSHDTRGCNFLTCIVFFYKGRFFEGGSLLSNCPIILMALSERRELHSVGKDEKNLLAIDIASRLNSPICPRPAGRRRPTPGPSGVLTFSH
jgi:hypothetical protein